MHIRQLRRELAAKDPHIGDFFQHDGVMHRIFGIFSPGERTVRVHQYARHLRCINALFLKGFDDHIPGFPFIFAVNLDVGHFARTGNRTVEIVGVSRARGRD